MMRSFGSSDGHLVLCEGMARQLEATYNVRGRCEVLNNAELVDPALRPADKLVVGRQEIVVGHLSNLCAEKGTDAFLDVMERLAVDDERLRIKLAGPLLTPEMHERLKQARSRLADRLEYLGPVAGVRKVEFFQALDLFVFPSRYVHEAEPLVLLESLACGVPCVATSRCCVAGDLGEAGIALPPDGKGLEEAIIGALAEHERLRSRSRARFEELREQSRGQIKKLIGALRVADADEEMGT